MDMFDEHTKQLTIFKKYVLGREDAVDEAGDMIRRAGGVIDLADKELLRAIRKGKRQARPHGRLGAVGGHVLEGQRGNHREAAGLGLGRGGGGGGGARGEETGCALSLARRRRYSLHHIAGAAVTRASEQQWLEQRLELSSRDSAVTHTLAP